MAMFTRMRDNRCEPCCTLHDTTRLGYVCESSQQRQPPLSTLRPPLFVFFYYLAFLKVNESFQWRLYKRQRLRAQKIRGNVSCEGNM